MLKLRCSKHPRYNGKHSPRASCQRCYEIWRIRNEALRGLVRLEVVESKGESNGVAQ